MAVHILHPVRPVKLQDRAVRHLWVQADFESAITGDQRLRHRLAYQPGQIIIIRQGLPPGCNIAVAAKIQVGQIRFDHTCQRIHHNARQTTVGLADRLLVRRRRPKSGPCHRIIAKQLKQLIQLRCIASVPDLVAQYVGLMVDRLPDGQSPPRRRLDFQPTANHVFHPL